MWARALTGALLKLLDLYGVHARHCFRVVADLDGRIGEVEDRTFKLKILPLFLGVRLVQLLTLLTGLVRFFWGLDIFGSGHLGAF